MATSFVICSDFRCGSHFIASALETRGDVFGDVEVLGDKAKPFIHESTVAARYAQLWKPARLRTYEAVGFIMHREDYVLDGDPVELLPDDCRVIFLHRHRQFRRYVSKMVARQRKKWQDYGEGGAIDCEVSIKVDLAHMISNIREYERRYDRYDRALVRFPRIHLTYEHMLADPAGTLDAIQEFLGLDPEPIMPSTRKQVARPLAEVVTDYEILVGLLCDTRFAMYCDGDDGSAEHAVPAVERFKAWFNLAEG